MTDATDSSDDPPAIGSPDDRIAYAKVLGEWLQGVEVPTAQLMAVVEARYLNEWMQLGTKPREGRKTTSAKAAGELCAIASVCLANNHSMPDVLRLHLAQALKAVASGKPADVALGVKRGAGPSRKRRSNGSGSKGACHRRIHPSLDDVPSPDLTRGQRPRKSAIRTQ